MPEYSPPPPDFIATHDDVLCTSQLYSLYCSPNPDNALLQEWGIIKQVWDRYIPALLGY